MGMDASLWYSDCFSYNDFIIIVLGLFDSFTVVCVCLLLPLELCRESHCVADKHCCQRICHCWPTLNLTVSPQELPVNEDFNVDEFAMETSPVDETEATGDELAGDLAEEFVADGSEAPMDKVYRGHGCGFGLAHCRLFPMMPQHRFNGRACFFFWFRKERKTMHLHAASLGLIQPAYTPP
jgi:hypothetical protein